MFYNKLIYTGVTRAKSSLIILGSLDSFNKSVQTSYGNNRKTYIQKGIKNHKIFSNSKIWHRVINYTLGQNN